MISLFLVLNVLNPNCILFPTCQCVFIFEMLDFKSLESVVDVKSIGWVPYKMTAKMKHNVRSGMRELIDLFL